MHSSAELFARDRRVFSHSTQDFKSLILLLNFLLVISPGRKRLKHKLLAKNTTFLQYILYKTNYSFLAAIFGVKKYNSSLYSNSHEHLYSNTKKGEEFSHNHHRQMQKHPSYSFPFISWNPPYFSSTPFHGRINGIPVDVILWEFHFISWCLAASLA